MKKVRVFEMPSLYREPLEITGYRFGRGEKSAAIVGAMRGNEIQQLYICSQLVRKLKAIEAAGGLRENVCIEVIPLRQSLFAQHRQALLGDGRHRHQPHVPGLRPGRDDAAHRRRRL